MTIAQRKWISVIVAVAAIVFGGFALGKPFESLENLPLLLLFGAIMLWLWGGSISHRAMIGAIILVVAFGFIASAYTSVMLLVYGAVAYLLVSGTVGVFAIKRGDWFTVIFGLAQILFGLLAAYWLDLTSILVGLLIGPAMIVIGLIALWRVWRGVSPNQPGRGHSHLAVIAARGGTVAMLLLGAAGAIGTGMAIKDSPAVDSFSDWSQPLGDTPGILLKSEPYDESVPDNATGQRILYTTTGLDGQITLATGLVIVPNTAKNAPVPVVLWAHGTSGVDIACAPSLLNDPLGADARIIPTEPLDNGWAIVAPDYLGLGASSPHPYLVGQPTAHSSLDAVRAARQLREYSLSDQTVVWGHSQGGGAALWIGIEAPIYAPDVPLLGIVALSPASNLPKFIDNVITTAAGPIFGGYILESYSNVYDDIVLHDIIRPGARFGQAKIVERCLQEPSILVSVITALIREPFTQVDLGEGAIVVRLAENVPSTPMGVPVFIGQGGDDPLIVPDVQAGYVQDLCDAGQVVEYHVYEGEDHLSVMNVESTTMHDSITWTTSRFAGDPPAESCSTSQD